MVDAKKAARTWLRAATRQGRRAAMPVVGLGLLGTALAVAQALAVANLLAAALTGQPMPDRFLILFVVAALLRAAAGMVSESAAVRAGASARARLRADALSRLLAAGPALLRQGESGGWTTTLMDRIEALDGLFARWLPASQLAIAGPALVLVVAWFADPYTALILLIGGLMVPFGMALAGIGAAAASKRQFLALSRLQARFVDRVRGIATIVLAGRADSEAESLGRAADELRRRTMRVLRVAFLSSTVLDLAAAGGVVLVAIHHGAALMDGLGGGHDTAGLAIALFALLLVPEFFAPLRNFALAYQDKLHAGAAAEALSALPPLPEPPPALPVRNVAAHGVAVGFEDVSLTWDPARGPALDGLSFRVPAGEVLVLAGPSGAGKSTVLEILLGFARPEQGRVLINGAPIQTILPEALSRLTAWIGQRPLIFAGSIEENIRFARPDATPEELREAVRAARLDKVVESLPLGLATQVGEGGYGLSGGQAQRVAIARAFLKNAPLLLLDEPTAHLDPATEAEVLVSLRRLAVGRTVILASHATAAHEFGGRRLDIRAGRAVAPAIAQAAAGGAA